MISLLSKSFQKTIWAKWVAFSSPMWIWRRGLTLKEVKHCHEKIVKTNDSPHSGKFSDQWPFLEEAGFKRHLLLTPARERPAQMRQAGLLTEPSDQDWEKVNKSLLWPWAGDDRFKGIHVSYCIRKIPHVSYSSLPSQAKVFIGLSNYQQHMPTYERFPWTMIYDRCTLHTLHWAGQDG